MAAKLTTHVLDTANGCPAAQMQIELWALTGNGRKLLKSVRSNADGRTEQPLLSGAELVAGQYELVFFVGDYFEARTSEKSSTRFLGWVPVGFGIGEPTANYHVPLLCSPWSYSTYRGS